MRLPFRLAAAGLLLSVTLAAPALAGGDLGQNPYEIGEQLFARKYYKTSLKYYGKALEQDRVEAHYKMGLAYEQLGRDRDALYHYQLFIDLGPRDDRHRDAVQRAAAIEGRAKSEAGRSARALERGKALFAKGKYREAEKVLLEALAKDPKNAEAHFLLGDVYLKRELYGKATAEYRRAKGSY
jgi:tetratricopeptide (TPR) repeat protein